MPRFRTAVLLAAVTPLGWACSVSAQPLATTPVTVDTTNTLPSSATIEIIPAAPPLTYTNADDGTLFGGITFQDDVTIINEAGATGLTPTDGGIATGIFQATGESGVLTFENSGFLTGSVGTSSDPLLAGDDTVTIFTTGVITGGIFLGEGNDTINLTGGEIDPDDTDDVFPDNVGSLNLAGVFDVETLNVDGFAGLTGDDRPAWFLNGLQNEDSFFTEGVTIGASEPVQVFLNGAIIRTDADSAITINSGSDFLIAGIVEGNIEALSGGTVVANGFTSVEGDVTFNGGGILQTFVSSGGAALELNVEGDVDLTGATLDLAENGEIFGITTTAVVLEAEGTVTSNFTAVTTDFTFLDGVTTVEDGVVTVTLTRNGTGLSTVAATENQLQAGLALEVIDATADPVDTPGNVLLADAFDALTTPAEEQAALESLAGESLASNARVATQALRGFARGMDRRSRMMQVYLAQGNALPSPQFASNAGLNQDLQLLTAAALAQPGGPAGRVTAIDTFVPGFWIDVLGGENDLDADGDFAGADFDYFGLIGGFDIQVSNEWVVGIAVGYTDGDLDVAERSGSTDLETVNLGAYTAFIVGNWRLNGGFSVAFDDYDTSRRVTVGTFDASASSDFEGFSWQVDGTATYRVDLPGEFRLEPFGTIEYVDTETDSYSESGAGSANLDVAEQNFDALFTTVGARLHKTFVWDRNTFTPEVRAGYQYEWLDTDADAVVTFADGGVATGVVITGVDPEDDAVLLGGGLTADFNRNFSLRADYDIRFSDDRTDQQVSVSLRIPW
ncbi:MAG: autotransporter domain-containing protein [Planctomycetota bacterium]